MPKKTRPKPLPMFLLFQENNTREEDDLVANGDRLFWIFARGSTNILFFFYIIWLLLYINNAQVDQMESIRIGKAQDLGSNPRSSIIPILFFNNISYAASVT